MCAVAGSCVRDRNNEIVESEIKGQRQREPAKMESCKVYRVNEQNNYGFLPCGTKIQSFIGFVMIL